jgi:hypothetical protein
MNFKTPLARLVRYLFQSREKWKARALENQQELRKIQVKTRDLEVSRKQWKKRAQQAEKELSLVKQGEQKPAKPIGASQEEGRAHQSIAVTHCDTPKWHSYSVAVIYLGICQVVRAFTGFRGGARSLEITAEVMGSGSPSYSSIRLWTYRLGYYLLQRAIEHREDRIFITDMTVELGKSKCLLILGVSESRFRQADFCLTHHDTEVLALQIFTQAKGEDIAACLEGLCQRIGVPKQIVSDQGSDIKKGIQLFQAKHPEVIYTPDLSHKIACMVKPLLSNDEVYQRFNTQCNQTKAAIQQTELNFLKPPTQRSKARYHHIAPRIEWAQKVLRYQQRGDFHLIDERYRVDDEVLQLMALPSSYGHFLAPIKGIIFNTWVEFDQAMSELLAEDVYQQHQQEWRYWASIGRQRFDEKLGWVSGYASDLEKYQQMLDVIESTELQLKHEGLHNESAQRLLQKLDGIKLDEKAKTLETQIIAYIDAHHGDVMREHARLVSSDVIESVFGQYKQVGHSGCLQELGKMVLLLPLLVTEITTELVLQAMNSVKTSCVDEWANKTFGPSALALRNAAFSVHL